MGIDTIVKTALTLIIFAALTGQLPRATRAIQIAEIKLLRQSQASHWGSPNLLYPNHPIHHRQ